MKSTDNRADRGSGFPEGYREALDGLAFPADAKERMAQRVACELGQAERDTQGAQVGRASRLPSRRRWRVMAAAGLAAVLALALGGAAYAGGGGLLGIAGAFDDLFGGPPAQTEVVGKIGRPLGSSATSDGVTVTAEAIIGDAANYVIVFTLAKDDGTPFDVEPLESGLFPLVFEGSVSVDGARGASGSSYFYDADPADNAIQYVEQRAVDMGDGSLIGKTARAAFTDLAVIGGSESDGQRRTIAEGTWKLKFAIDYEDTSVALASGQAIDLNGMPATIDAISLSPVALSVDYTVDAVMDWESQQSGRMSDHNQAQADAFHGLAMAVNLRDGTVVDAAYGGLSTREDGGATHCRKNSMFNEFLNLDDVASVTIAGVEVPLA